MWWRCSLKRLISTCIQMMGDKIHVHRHIQKYQKKYCPGFECANCTRNVQGYRQTFWYKLLNGMQLEMSVVISISYVFSVLPSMRLTWLAISASDEVTTTAPQKRDYHYCYCYYYYYHYCVKFYLTELKIEYLRGIIQIASWTNFIQQSTAYLTTEYNNVQQCTYN